MAPLLVGLTVAVAGARTTSASSPPRERPAAVAVSVDSAIDGHEELASWAREELVSELSTLPRELPETSRIHVSISGAIYDYQVEVSTWTLVESSAVSFGCECSNEELLERLKGALMDAAESLATTDGDREPAAADPVSPPGLAAPIPSERREMAMRAGLSLAPMSPVDDGPTKEPVLSRRGWVGVGVGSAGVVATVVGSMLTSVGVREGYSLEDAAIMVDKDYRVPGIPVLTIGLGMVVSGVVLVVLDRRRRRSSPGRTSRGIQATGGRHRLPPRALALGVER